MTVEQLPEPGTPAHRDLVERAARGADEATRRSAFSALVRLHWTETWRVCAAIAGPTLADDAVQDAFVRAFEAMADDPPREFRTWLLAIARNRACDLRRAHHRYREVVGHAADASLLDEQPAVSPEARVIWLERVERLRRTLDEEIRNPNQRDAFLMRLNTRLSDEEIGEVLGISAKAVRSYVCQVRKRLLAVLCEA